MSAKNLKFPKTEAQTSGGTLAVRGLSTTDIGTLAASYPDAVRTVFEMFKNGGIVGVDLMPVITGFPELVADAIAMATGDYGDLEGMKAVREIPMPDQLEVLASIGQATFTTDDSIKKFVATALGMIQGAREAVPELT